MAASAAPAAGLDRVDHDFRLPRAGPSKASVRGSPGIPANAQIPEREFPQAYADFELTTAVIRSARSIVGLYNLPTNGKTLEDKITVVVQVRAGAEGVRAMLEGQKEIIVALTKGAGQCVFVQEDGEVPGGVGSEVVGTEIVVHIPVQVSADACGRGRAQKILRAGNLHKDYRC